MTEAPWIKWYTSDFLTGVGSSNLKADEIGVYSVILSLIADRGAPIPNDRAWIAGRAGTSTRRCNQIVDRLIELGKLETREGLLGNQRMLKEVKKRDGKSDQARAAAFTRWHSSDQPELDLDARSADYPGIKSRKSEEHVDLISGKKQQKPQKSAKTGDADECLTRARPRSETRVKKEESTSTHHESPATDGDGPDLLKIAGDLARQGGVPLINPGQIASAVDLVRQWIVTEAIPLAIVEQAIQHQFENTAEDRIASLRFYGQAVAGAAARAQRSAKSTKRNGQAHPIMSRDDETEAIALLRQTLFERMGREAYCTYVNPVRFEAVEGAARNQKPLRVHDHRYAGRLNDNGRARILREVALSHGFTDVW